MVTVSYLGYQIYLWKKGRLCPRKLVLLAIFVGASYYLYVYLADFIVGFAVWSAFHCLQYYGIVWAYNGNRVQKGSPMTSLARFLFRPSAALVLLYAALILGYGAINYTQKFVHDAAIRRLLLAFVATSSVLHYYYDGFIWRLRQPETRRFLRIDGTCGPRRPLPIWNQGLMQAAYLAAAVVMLAVLETRRPNHPVAVRQSLAVVASAAEESHLQLGDALRQRERFAEALDAYGEAVRLKPAWAEAHLNRGVTLAALGRIGEAIGAYEKALSIDPGIPAAHYNVAVLLANQGATERALSHYLEALKGNDPDARRLAQAGIEELRSARQ
jgi:tetratricopeptide (TPR) repeat protein